MYCDSLFTVFTNLNFWRYTYSRSYSRKVVILHLEHRYHLFIVKENEWTNWAILKQHLKNVSWEEWKFNSLFEWGDLCEIYFRHTPCYAYSSVISQKFARILHIYAASTTLYVWKVKLRQCHAHRILVSECVCTYYLTHESSSWAWWRHFSWSIRIFLRYHYTCAKSNTVWTFFWVNFVYLWLQHTSWSYFVDHYADWLISWDDLIYWLLNHNAMFSL